MKYALFDFYGDEGGLEVGESVWINEVSLILCNNEAFDFNNPDVTVTWKTKGKKAKEYRAKVVRFSDSRDELVGLRDKLISSDTETVSDEVTLKKSSKGRRIIRQAASSDDEELHINKRQKIKVDNKKTDNKTKNELETLRTLLNASNTKSSDDCSSADCIAEKNELRKAVEKMKQENDSLQAAAATYTVDFLRCTQRSLNDLPAIVNDLKLVAAHKPSLTPVTKKLPSGSNPGSSMEIKKSSSISSISARSTASDLDSSFTESPSTNILKSIPQVVHRFTDARKMTNALLVAQFGEELASCSLSGGLSSKTKQKKPALDGEKVATIIDTVMAKYPGTSQREVRLWISEKASNAAKQVRKPRTSDIINDNSVQLVESLP